MGDGEALRLLGSPDVRNAILLNEVGVLLHDLGKLSADFVERGDAFPYHLVLRRLTRGRDPLLASDASPRSALFHSLQHSFAAGEERRVARLLMEALSRDQVSRPESPVPWLEEGLSVVYSLLDLHLLAALETVAQMARGVLRDLAWQVRQEEEVGAMAPPFIAVEGFHRGLDQLPFVADVVEMQGRTWHPEPLLPPEVRLFRAIHSLQPNEDGRRSSCDLEHLANVRDLYCEVMANQFLEINSIRKDGPGDLGSWFWKSRLCSHSEGASDLLRAFDRGAGLEGEEREAVRWLGVRAITRWALGKILVGDSRDGGWTSLWDHCWRMSGLFKSSTAQALIEGNWPERSRLSWCTLNVELERPQPQAVDVVKDLVEMEYPLGNELGRGESGISFTFPSLESELRAPLLDDLRAAIGRALGTDQRFRVTIDSQRPGSTGDDTASPA